MSRHAEQRFLVVAALAAWAGLVLQFVVSLPLFPPALSAAWRMLGYFTVLTNLIVAVFFTVRIFRPVTPFIATWVCLSITFVGAGYVLLLARLYDPQGMGWLANALLHYVTPAVGFTYWLAFVPKGTLSWRDALTWATYIIAYGLYAIARGTSSGFYPYPFLDLPRLGSYRVAMNVIGLLAAYVAAGMLFVVVDRQRAKRP